MWCCIRSAGQALAPADFLHQTFTEQRFQDAVAVDSPDGIHLRPGDRLLVGDDRQSFQGRPAQLGGGFQSQKTLNQGAHLRGGGELYLPGMPLQAQAALLVISSQASQAGFNFFDWISRAAASWPGVTGPGATSSNASSLAFSSVSSFEGSGTIVL